MKKTTYKELIDNGYVLAFWLDFFGRYKGIIYGNKQRAFLRTRDFQALTKYKSIHKLLKNSNRIIKISGCKDHYILQMLDIHPIDFDSELYIYQLEDLESASTIDGLLAKYDRIKQEATLTYRIFNK